MIYFWFRNNASSLNNWGLLWNDMYCILCSCWDIWCIAYVKMKTYSYWWEQFQAQFFFRVRTMQHILEKFRSWFIETLKTQNLSRLLELLSKQFRDCNVGLQAVLPISTFSGLWATGNLLRNGGNKFHSNLPLLSHRYLSRNVFNSFSIKSSEWT